MDKQRIAKLPKWAQEYIADLESEVKQSRLLSDAAMALLDGAPEIKPDVAPPERIGELSVGYIASRGESWRGLLVEKACSSSVNHAVGHWEGTSTKGPKHLYSTPQLAAKAVLPQIVKAYQSELAKALRAIARLKQD